MMACRLEQRASGSLPKFASQMVTEWSVSIEAEPYGGGRFWFWPSCSKQTFNRLVCFINSFASLSSLWHCQQPGFLGRQGGLDAFCFCFSHQHRTNAVFCFFKVATSFHPPKRALRAFSLSVNRPIHARRCGKCWNVSILSPTADKRETIALQSDRWENWSIRHAARQWWSMAYMPRIPIGTTFT